MASTISTADLVELIAQRSPQLVEVLPRAAYAKEHLPGAISIPLGEFDETTIDGLDRNRPVVTYCYDLQCDLSARAAARLDALGFDDVFDYAESKVAWFSCGLPSEGLVADRSRAGALARPVPTCAPNERVVDVAERFDARGVVAVVDAEEVVLGLLRHEAANLPDGTCVAHAMQPAPSTVRPAITAPDLARDLEKDGKRGVLVTTITGRLIGYVERSDLHGRH